MIRLSKDSTVPASLRDALQRAGRETAPPGMLKQVLGASALGAGAAAIAMRTGAGASQLAPTLVRASVAAKGLAAVAIFVAGGIVGGYAVHEHDVRQASEALRTPMPVEAAPTPLAAPPPAVPDVAAVVTGIRSPSSLVIASPVKSRESSVETEPAPAFTVGPPSAAASVAPAAPSLRDELAGLRAIRDAVTSARGGDALVAIEAYRQRFPSPAFDQELLFLEAQARSMGHDPAACRVLDHFAAAYPASLLVPRARALRTSAKCP